MPTTQSETAASPPVAGASSRGGLIFKAVIALVAVVALVLAGKELGGYIPQFAAWVESLGIWGPLVFIAGYAAATVAFVPGSLLTLAAGAIFGLGKGTLLVFFGSTLGASLAFLIARYLARGAIERRLEDRPKFRSIDSAVGKQGRKIVFLLRLSPAFPYSLLNYGLGLTRVRFVDYVIACIGMLPGTFLYVYYGKALGSLAEVAGGARPDKGAADWILLGVGLAATLAVTTIITRIARRALQEVEDE